MSFYEALDGKPSKHCTDEELAEEISIGMENAIYYLGLKSMSEKDIDLLKYSVMMEVRACFGTLTLKELRTAVFHGLRGRYDKGDVYGLPPVRVAKWFAAYMMDSERQTAKKKLIEQLEPKRLPPTPEQEKVSDRDYIIFAFNKHNEGGFFDSDNIVYQLLVDMKVIAFTPERKKDFMQQAIKDVGAEKNAFRKASEKITETKQNNSLKHNPATIAAAKRIALNTFFNELAEMGQDITELITN